MKVLGVICLVLLIIGGLNWGCIGIADYNFIDGLFGAGLPLTRGIYCLVGLSAIYKSICCCGIKDRACRR